MYKKIFFVVVLFFASAQLFAQQIPVGMCGIIYIYDANGARVKRVYFCNNGLDPYPTARVAATSLIAENGAANIVEEKGTTAVFEKAEAIFPNPTTGKFSMTFSKVLQNANIIITDVNGKKVHQSKGNGNRLSFDLSNLGAGVYFVRIEEVGKVITEKIVKQ
jgi:Secretion system C-terminal sorting domain